MSRILPGDRGTQPRLDERRLDHPSDDRHAGAHRRAEGRNTCRGWRAGEALGAFAFSEPNAGSDLSSLACRARRDGDEWVITGNKYWCTFADGADYILVLARTDPEAQRHRGISAFMIEKERGSLPAGVHGAPIPKIGYFGWKTWELSFDECRVPHAQHGRRRGQGFLRHHQRAGNCARPHRRARDRACPRRARGCDRLREGTGAVRHAARRDFQAIRFKLAEMATEVEAARQLLLQVCRHDRHRRALRQGSRRWPSCTRPRWPSG